MAQEKNVFVLFDDDAWTYHYELSYKITDVDVKMIVQYFHSHTQNGHYIQIPIDDKGLVERLFFRWFSGYTVKVIYNYFELSTGFPHHILFVTSHFKNEELQKLPLFFFWYPITKIMIGGCEYDI